MRELVDAQQVGRLFTLLALLLPPLGAFAGWIVGSRRGDRRGALIGLTVGMLGPLNYLLWLLYNRITDSLGLDTVRNLFVNLAVFIIVGVLIGVCAGIAIRRVTFKSDDRPPSDSAE